MTPTDLQDELDGIIQRTQVKMLVGVLKRPEDSYEWPRACLLYDVLKAGKSANANL